MNDIVEALNESNRFHLVEYGALIMLLLEKGVFSQEELNNARVQATVIVDQESARKRDTDPTTLELP